MNYIREHKIISVFSFVVIGVGTTTFLYIAFRHQAVHYPLDDARSIGAHFANLRDIARANPFDDKALVELISNLKSDDSFTRTEAATYIGQLGPKATPAVNALTSMLEQPDPFASGAAAESLGEIGPGAKGAIPALIRTIHRRPNSDAACFAVESLSLIADPNDPVVLDELKNSSQSSIALLSRYALRAMKQLERRGKALSGR